MRKGTYLRKVSLFVGLAVIGGAMLIPASSAGTAASKPYTANICASGPCTPVTAPTLAGGSATTVDLTIANQTGSQSMGSANVTAPVGFTVTGVSPLPSQSSFSGALIQLRNLNIAAGTSKTFTISVSVPCQPPASSAWAITAKQANNFNGPPGNDLTLVQPSSLTTPVTGACKLVFVKQPANAQVGKTITSVAYNPASADVVRVEVHDGSDALVSTASGSVTLTPTSNAASFSGNTNAALSGGVATFPALKSSAAGTYTLTASATGYASSDPSSQFKIGSKLVFLAQPQDAQTGATITSADLNPGAAPVQVAVVPPDAVAPYTGANAPIASATGSVALTPSPMGSFTGTSASFSGTGTVTFPSLKGSATGTYTVTANDQSSSTAATSDPFTIADFGTICPAGDTTCTGNTSSSDKKTNASVTSTTGGDGFPTNTTLEITMLAAGPPSGVCGDFTPAPNSQGVAVDVRPLTDLTQVTITLDKSIVNAFPDNGVAHFNICFGGLNLDQPGTPFTTKSGALATFDSVTGLFWGILRDCSGTPTEPCVVSRNKNGGKAVLVFDVPNPWDLKGWAG